MKTRKEVQLNAKDYLREIALLDIKINTILEHISDLRAKLTTIPSTSRFNPDKIPRSGIKTEYKTEEIIDKIVALEKEANGSIDEYVDRKTEALGLIHSLKNPTHIQILTKHYLGHKSWELVARELNLSYRHTVRVHGWALVAFQEVLDRKYSRMS